MARERSMFISLLVFASYWGLFSFSRMFTFVEKDLEFFKVLDDFNSTRWYTVPSITECAFLCERDSECVSLTYSESDQSCLLYLKLKERPVVEDVKIRMTIWQLKDTDIYQLFKTRKENSTLLCLGDRSRLHNISFVCPKHHEIFLAPTMAWRDNWDDCDRDYGPCMERTLIFDHCSGRQRCEVTYRSVFLQSCRSFATAMMVNYRCAKRGIFIERLSL